MKFIIVGGLIFFIGSIILIVSNYEELKVGQNGRVVEMQITDLPKSCIGAKIRYFVTYVYQGKSYEKPTTGNFCKAHFVGEKVRMKLLDGSRFILYPDESGYKNLVSFAILGLLGLGMAIFQLKRIIKH